MRTFAVVLLACAIAATAHGQTIDECLQQDSIACVQKSLFRKAREFFDRDNFEILTGVSLVKSNKGDRSSRSGKDLVYEQEIDQATTVAERQSALENFVGEEVTDFFSGRSLRINLAPALEKIGESARAISESVPAEVKQAVDEVVEGRGKKKLFKKLMPLLVLVKFKLEAFATLMYFALALIAKKAILASLISIAISGFVGLKALWASKGSGADTTGYSSGGWSSGAGAGASSGWAAPSSGGWSSGGGSGWDDGHGAQSQAYSGYHH